MLINLWEAIISLWIIMKNNHCILGKWKMKNMREREFLLRKILCLKEVGWIHKKYKEYKSQQKEYTKENSSTDSVLKLDNFIGTMENIILENGTKIKNMVLGYGNQKKGMFIWVIGLKEKYKGMVFIWVKVDKNIKDFFLIFSNKDKENNISQMEIIFKVNSNKENLMERVSISGRQESAMKENS